MSAISTRTVTFQANNLGTDAVLMLTFDKSSDGLYKNKFPVCWKFANFGSSGSYRFSVKLEGELAFSMFQVDYSDIVNTGRFTKIDVGEKTTLTKDDNGNYTFTSPENTGSEDTGSTTLTACNGTTSKENMAICVDDGYTRTPLLCFMDVGADSSVEEDFTPVLRAYVTSQYQEKQIIRGDVGNPLWEQNLTDLDDDVTLNVKYEFPRFTITKA